MPISDLKIILAGAVAGWAQPLRISSRQMAPNFVAQRAALSGSGAMGYLEPKDEPAVRNRLSSKRSSPDGKFSEPGSSTMAENHCSCSRYTRNSSNAFALEHPLASCYIESVKRSLQLRSLRLLGRSRLSY